jgi:hypothetical protein
MRMEYNAYVSDTKALKEYDVFCRSVHKMIRGSVKLCVLHAMNLI